MKQKLYKCMHTGLVFGLAGLRVQFSSFFNMVLVTHAGEKIAEIYFPVVSGKVDRAAANQVLCGTFFECAFAGR